MSDNVVRFERPRKIRPVPDPLGLFVRAGHNDHVALLDMFSAGDANCFGVVFDPSNLGRHRELREQVIGRGLDAVLDPRTQPSATIGGFTEKLGELPWGVGRPHSLDDFRGERGREAIAQIGNFVIENGFTKVLGPTHLLQSSDDPWLMLDAKNVEYLRNYLDANGGANVPLVYSLAIPYGVFRDKHERRRIVDALRDVPAAEIWLKIEKFGSSSNPTAARTYIEACSDFHSLEIPIVGDQVGGLVGLGLLAFGAVGGIAHGVTLQERFDASYWRRPREKGGARSMPRRIYVKELDLMLKPAEAELLLGNSSRAHALFGCRNRHCCPRGVRDMMENPARHFLYQRMLEVSELSEVPNSLRFLQYLEHHLRPVTDRALAAANINWSNDVMAKKTRAHRKRLDSLRIAFGHHAESAPPRSFASVPLRRAARD